MTLPQVWGVNDNLRVHNMGSCFPVVFDLRPPLELELLSEVIAVLIGIRFAALFAMVVK